MIIMMIIVNWTNSVILNLAYIGSFIFYETLTIINNEIYYIPRFILKVLYIIL